jgi:lipopolysaccharide export LptBFGC system permease protein LptF
MVVLKKVKSATLVEVIVASVLIVIVFMIASLVLNNLVLNTFSKNTHSIETRLNALEYELQNGLVQLPYEENYKGWDIVIQTEKTESKENLLIMATNSQNKKEIKKQRIHD